MSSRTALTIGTVVAVIAYCAASISIVSASLAPREVCQASGGPPDDLPVERVSLSNRVDGVRLAAWLVSARADRAVVLVHGIDSDAWASDQPELARAYASAGFDVLLFDQRAHGHSEGEHVTLGLRERDDVRSAVDLLLARGVAPGRIGVHGTSYGAAMALVAVADIPEVGAIIADSAFADARDLIASEVAKRTQVPNWLAGSLLRPGIQTAAQLLHGLDLAKLAPVEAIARIAPRPLLLIHGEQDTVIPVEHARRLKSGARENSDLWILPDAGHTEGMRRGPCKQQPSPIRAIFFQRVVSFLDTALRPT